MITTEKRQNGTKCPMCSGTDDVVLIRLNSDLMSGSFALCVNCRDELIDKLRAG